MSTKKEVAYNINHETGCWECTSHKPDSYGYAVVTINKKRHKLHRYMYELYKGAIPVGLLIRHTCDNRICINPDHLLVGTVADNVKDSIERGRHVKYMVKAVGKRVHRRKKIIRLGKPIKLTSQDVIEIRQSSIGGSEIARQYNISRRSVWEIRQRVTWKHI
jgi:hypothetical protein